MNQAVDCGFNRINLGRLQNVEKNIVNVFEYVTFGCRFKLFCLQDRHLQTDALDFGNVEFIQTLVLFLGDQSINDTIRNSADSAFSLDKVRQTCHSRTKPTDSLLAILDCLPI